ncbi:hypothetical protein [Cohnella silvisoli]|uniref:Uncharacterized protein n=1 Tax=Cohnella silvisoli TaxID=2873699 RepID=A0ABV1L2J8_9BACL|nr:hypothetical protein [Cohnella silvisoli]MCD9021596.1 hypothetical protein [Cohnella silvisoli]
MLYGLGKLLRQIRFLDGRCDLPELQLTSRPDKAMRGIYFAAHFGNWYCLTPLSEIAAYLEELALWGVNDLMTWFDLSNYSDLQNGQSMLDRIEWIMQYAGQVGMRTTRVSVSNEGFSGQVGLGRPMLARNAFNDTDYHPLRAVDRAFGGMDTDICPSQPDGRKLVLHNKERYFSQLQHVGSVVFWPYDPGGCNCERCLPWPGTFMSLNRELAERIGRLHPHARFHVSAWWFEAHREGEDDAFFTQLEKDSKLSASWFDCIFVGHAEAARWKDAGRTVPKRHPLVLFSEISMFDAIPWGGKGANPALHKFMDELDRLGDYIDGAMCYSEGIYEDLNKVAIAQKLWDERVNPGDIAAEYSNYYFGADCAEQASWYVCKLEELVSDPSIGSMTAHELEQQAGEVERSMKEWARSDWRWQLLRLRAAMQARIDTLKSLGEHPALLSDRREVVYKEFEVLYDDLQFRLYRHHPKDSLQPWIYAPASQAISAFVGKTDLVNLTSRK